MMDNAPGILLSRFFVVDTPHAAWMAGLALVFWGGLLILAFRRPDRRLLPLRAALLTLAAGSLLLAGLQPARKVLVDTGTALLLTAGATPDAADSLRRALAPDLVATFDSTLAKTYPPAGRLPDIEYLRRHFPGLQRLLLAGHGLTEQELALLAGLDVRFHPAPFPGGVVDFSYSRQVAEGDSLVFTGYYEHRDAEARRLFLESPNGKDLLLACDSAGRYSFSLVFPARQAGRYLFYLVEETARRRTLHRVPLPVLITPAPTLRVLILNDAPSFETKYLKNWLAGQGYRVAVRSTVSRDQFKTEFYNLPEIDLAVVSTRTLERFDLVLVAAAALPQWSPAQRLALRRAAEEGLGVILLAGDGLPSLPAADRSFFLDFPLLSGTPAFRLPDVEADVEIDKAPYHIDESFGAFPLAISNTGKVISAFRFRGSGRLALYLGAGSYRLLLAGKGESYARHWTSLLEGVARRVDQDTRWEISEPLLILPHEPAVVRVHTAQAAPIAVLTGPDSAATAFYLEQDPLLPERWSGVVWPRRQGWHRLSLQGDPGDSTWIYVPAAGEWESLNWARRQENTRRWIARHAAAATAPAGNLAATRRPYPLWWFYVVFLLAAGGLWLEEKW